MFFKKVILRLKWMFNDLLALLGIPYRQAGQGDVRVLCFHGVCTNETTFINGRFLHQSHFQKLLDAISEHYHVISLQEFLDKNFRKDKLNVMLTFDDGYRNNLEFALPELSSRTIPATIFCTSKQLLWTDLLDIAKAKQNPLVETRNTFEAIRLSGFEAIKRWAIAQNAQMLESFTEVLRSDISNDLSGMEAFFELLNDDELQELSNNPLISLASHGGSHLSYLHQSEEAILDDVHSAKVRLNKFSGNSNVFAYPFGHYSGQIGKLLTENGITVQFITDGNPNHDKSFYDRLVINPYISIRNQLIAIRNGKY